MILLVVNTNSNSCHPAFTVQIPAFINLLNTLTWENINEGNNLTIKTKNENKVNNKIIKIVDEAAEALSKEGINVEVIDLRTIRPWDEEAVINSVKKTNRLLIVEESWPVASIASEVTYRVQREAFDYLDAPIKRITTADTPAPYSPVLLDE